MYYKILNTNLKHYNMQYQEGLNVNCEDTVFDGEPGHGLSFADERHIIEFSQYGSLIADVTLPENEKYGKCISTLRNSHGLKAHKIYLSNIRPLYDIKILDELKSFGVDLHANDDILLKTAIGYHNISNPKIDVVRYLIKDHKYSDETYRFALVHNIDLKDI